MRYTLNKHTYRRLHSMANSSMSFGDRRRPTGASKVKPGSSESRTDTEAVNT